MNTPTLKLTFLTLSIAAASAAAGYGLAMRNLQPTPTVAVVPPAPVAAPKPLYWYDPMEPNQHFDKPGKSPFMDMQLLPKYPDASIRKSDAGTVSIDPALTQNLGMRVVTVQSGTLPVGISAPGTVVFNERDVAVVQARTGGFVQRVYGRAPGDIIPAGAPLVDMVVPEWSAAQNEFLALNRSSDAALADAARERLRLLGMSPAQIQRIARTGQADAVTTITTPIGGLIQTLDVRAGMSLTAGQNLARINGLSTVWLDVAVPQTQLDQIGPGAKAEIHFNAFPGETRIGKVIAILPETVAESRSLKLRIELPNRDGRLRPGMFASVDLAGKTGRPVLLVPSEAIIHTGKRSLVMVAEDNGHYRPVEIQAGAETGGQTVVLSGLSEGQQVVASGQFLIDSEANLSGIVAKIAPAMKAGGEQ